MAKIPCEGRPTGQSILSDVTFSSKVDFASGNSSCVQIGNIVIINFAGRLKTAFSANENIISGLPTAKSASYAMGNGIINFYGIAANSNAVQVTTPASSQQTNTWFNFMIVYESV